MKRILFLALFLASLASSASAQLSQATITGTIYALDGSVKSGVKVRVVRVTQSGSNINANTNLETTSAIDGTWSLTLPRSSTAWFCSPNSSVISGMSSDCNRATAKTIPNSASATFQSLTTVVSFPTGGFVVKDEGTSLSDVATTLNFVGSGVAATQASPGVATITISGGSGSGTVTDFSAGNLSPLFTSSVATSTSTPALTFSLSTQSANRIFAGPTTGSAAAPTFRALVAADIPDLSGTYQPLDGDLTTIAGLTPTNDDVLQRKAGAWVNRSIAQLKTDLGYATIATSGSASDLSAGTVPLARLSGITTAELSATAGITNGQLAGSIAFSKIAITGTPDGTKFVRDDGSFQNIPGGGDALTSNPLSQFASTTSAQLAGVLSDETGSGGGFVRATSPTITTPTIANLANLTSNGLVTTSGGDGTLGVTVPGTGILAALGVNVGSAGAPVLFNGAGGTPSSLTLTNGTGLPIGGITGLGTGVGTWLATPSSANFAAAITDETGTGALVFGTSPDFTTGATIGGVAIPTISSTSTLTNKTISGASNTLTNIANASLSNSGITIAGTPTSLGAAITLDTITGLSTTGLVKRTAANTLAIATSGTDYAPATSGNSILYGNGSGGFSAVTVGSGLDFTDGTLTATGGGTGDVVGPASATDNAVVRFDLTTGKLIQNSVVTIADTSGNMAGVGTLNGHTIPGGTDTFAMLGTAQTFTANQTFGSGILRATSPRITTGILDANGNSAIALTATSSAVNGFTVTNAATGGNVKLSATGSDTNISLELIPKGTDATNGGQVVAPGNRRYDRPGITFDGASTEYGLGMDGSSWFLVNAPNIGLGVGDGFSEGLIAFNGHTYLAWGSSTATPKDDPPGQDLFRGRRAAATHLYGKADAAAPVAQTFTVQGVVAGTSNTAGVNTTWKASAGTGTGAGGSLIWQVAPAGSSGSTQNSYQTALTIASDKSATFTGDIQGTTATFSGAITVASCTGCGGGGVSDGDKGDITVSSSGTVWTIDNGVVSNAKLANSAITIAGTSTSLGNSITLDTITGLSSTGLVKRTGANTLATATAGTDYASAGAVTSSGLTMATARLLGRSTASTGAIEEITVGSGLSLSGGTLSASGGGGGLTIGTTTVTSGTGGRFLYETSGNVVGQISTLTSDGTIVTFAPTVTTGSGSTAGLAATANSLTTGNAFDFSSSSVTTGNVVSIAATGTAAASNTKTALRVATSGANGTSTQTTYGGRFSNTSTGTTSTNIGLEATASGGTNNYGVVITSGNLAFGGTASGNLMFKPDGSTGGAFRRGDDSNLSGVIYGGSFAAGTSAGGKAMIDAGNTAPGIFMSSDSTFYFANSTSAASTINTLGLKLKAAGLMEINTGSAGAIGTTPGNARDLMLRGTYFAETTSDPSAAELSIAGSNAQDVFRMYMKNDKLVVAVNRSGTVNYLTIPLDGSTTTFSWSTSAP